MPVYPQRQYYAMPVVACGTTAGLLSFIYPLSCINCCFGLWIVAAAWLSIYWVEARADALLRFGESVLVGTLTGLVAGGLSALVMLTTYIFIDASHIPWWLSLPTVDGIKQMMEGSNYAKTNPYLEDQSWRNWGVVVMALTALFVYPTIGAITGMSVYSLRGRGARQLPSLEEDQHMPSS